MEKLIELLNEYEYSMFEDKSLATEWGDIQDGVVFEKNFCETIDDKKRDVTMNETHLISKKYGFIKRLVDNDKINIDKYYEFMTNENIDINNACGELDMDKEFYYGLLMILAVQDNSIEFLISILK